MPKYKPKGSVDAFRIVQKTKNVDTSLWLCQVETDRGEIVPMLCKALIGVRPLMGDYVIAQSPENIFHCSECVFNEKYEAIVPF